MTPRIQQRAFGWILEGLAIPDAVDHRRDLDLHGIGIRMDYAILSPKNQTITRAALPQIAAIAQAWGDATARAHLLALVAPFQANAGDFTGALATARSIPDVKRSDFSGPSDGYHEVNEAVKTITFAYIAGVQGKSGNQSAAIAALGEALALARGLKAEDQKLIAQIVIAQKNIECGRRDVAKAIITETLPIALAAPEPRRSRVLEMLVVAQLHAGDASGAARTMDAIREYPGLEKAGALSVLARWHEKQGDAASSEKLLRRAVACLAAKAPEKPLQGKTLSPGSFGRDTFTELDQELNPEWLARLRKANLQDFCASLGDLDAAVRSAKALPPEQRDEAMSGIAGQLAGRGDIGRALDMATSIETADARLSAFAALADAIADGQVKK